MHQPSVFRRGQKFHEQVQNDWRATAEGVVVPECFIRLGLTRADGKSKSGRADILVQGFKSEHEWVAIVEIKSTDWDAIKTKNIMKNIYRHQKQLFKYVDEYLENRGIEVCLGIIYPSAPKTPGLREKVEAGLIDYGIPVVWYDEA